MKKVVLLVFVLVLLSTVVVVRFVRPVTAVLPVHNIDTGLDYATIREAINANETLDGHTILVDAGTYYEHVVVNKSVSLVGEDRETTIIDGNMSGTVVDVTATGVLISNFTIRNSGNQTMDSGVKVEMENCSITDNLITNNQYGVLLFFWSSNNTILGNNVTNNSMGVWLGGSNNTISGNNITNNRYSGVHLSSSPNSTISGNYVSNNEIGVYLIFSPNSTISGNVMNGNKYGLSVDGDPTLSIDVSNLVDGKPVYYLVNQKDLVINSSTYPDVGYLALVNCSNIVVEGLTLTNNGQGLLLSTNNSRITGNNITNNLYGVYLGGSNNTISGNNITNNQVGVLSFGSNNTMTGNNVTNNSMGVWLGGSNNTITENTFVNDGLFVFLDSYGNEVKDNLVNGKPLVYLEGVSDYTVGNAGQVILVNCSRILVENLDLSNTTAGVQLLRTNSTTISGNNITNNAGMPGISGGVTLWFSYYTTISGNNITNDQVGVHLSSSPNSTITGNNISNNRMGVWLISDDVVVERNRITDNDNGVYIFSGSHNLLKENNISSNVKGISFVFGFSEDNKIYHNNFIENEIQVSLPESPFPSTSNVWDNGYPSGGNYWSDYNGTDINQDGIGDTPYVIDENNQDNYPLMNPVGSPQPPIAFFTYIPEHPVKGEIVSFNASVSYDRDGFIASYEWNFGDGNITTVTDPSITHVYTAWDTYTVNLTVTDNDGLTHSTTKSIAIEKISSIITINIDPATVTVGSNVTINGNITPTKGDVNVTISYRPLDATWTTLATVKTDSNSNYTYTWKTTDEGTYEIKASWLGDENTSSAESETKTVIVDSTPPTIGIPSRTPEGDVLPDQSVKVSVNVTDALSGVKQVTLIYAYANSSGTWIRVVDMINLEGNVWNATIPAFPYGTNVTYIIRAQDNIGNTITTEEMGYEYQYQVIPEFPTWASILLILMVLTVAIAIYKRKLRVHI